MARKTTRGTVKTIVGRKQTFLGSTGFYIALGSIGLLGFVSLSAIASWLLKTPPYSELVSSQSVVVAAPQSQELSAEAIESATTEPGITETPQQSSYTQFLSQAAARAESAENITLSAFSTSDWKLIVAKWQEAIQIVEQVPEGDPLYSEAQQKKSEYLLALSYAQQGKAVPDASAIFLTAFNVATEADQLSQSARSPEDWENVAQRWKEASTLMGQVPTFADQYQTAQAKVSEYATNQDYAQAQINHSVVADPTTGVASVGSGSTSSSSNGGSSGNCDYPWQYDSAGNLCGDRAASVREGGRLGGSGSSSSTSASSSGSNCHRVSGYTRKDGTRVRGHYRCR